MRNIALFGRKISSKISNPIFDATWMGDETKEKAREKLNKIAINVAYPEWINDQATVDEKYDGFEVIDGNYIGTRLRRVF